MKTITARETEKFKAYLLETEKSENTVEKYMRDIRFFKEWLGKSGTDKAAVLAYKKELCKLYAPKSVNSMLSSLNAFFRCMGWHECKIKTLKIQRQIFADKEKELPKADYGKLLLAAKQVGNERLYYLMQTLGGTGIRISELPYITAEAVTAGKATINCKGKIRQVFLPKELCRMLKGYMKKRNINNGAVFITKSGKPLDRSTVWKMMKRLCENAHVSKKKVFPHNFRHLFARAFYAVQKDIVRLADLLGHTSIETTRIYTIESGETHKMQLARLGLLRI